MWAVEALDRFISELGPGALVLDIGAGSGKHSELMRRAGLLPIEHDYETEGDYVSRYYEKQAYDGIWASHVLEHMPNVAFTLYKIFHELKPGGLLAITVPPRKDQIVGGHVSLWNGGLLLYNLILAGFDCSEARLGTYGYNISVLVRKRAILNMPKLKHDSGDIERLSAFFPIPVSEGFDGRLQNVNW